MPIFDRFRSLFRGGQLLGQQRRPLLSVIEYDVDPHNYWNILGELGDGAFGKVEKVVSKLESHKLAAAKRIEIEDGENLEDFLVEIEILTQCKHENIVSLLACYFFEGKLSMMLEFCAGGAIDSIMIELEKPLTEPQIAYVTRNVCHALEYLHSNYVIHRDLKAGNILLTSDATVKLADFGVSAKMKDRNEQRDSFIGTPYWMAPEVMICETFKDQPYNCLADIWSLGITLIEMAQMDPPNYQVSPMRVVIKVQKCDPPTLDNPSKWSSYFNNFIAKCLVKNLLDRCTALELLSHPFLKDALSKKPIIQLLCEKNADIQEEMIIDEESSTGGSVADSEDRYFDFELTQQSDVLPSVDTLHEQLQNVKTQNGLAPKLQNGQDSLILQPTHEHNGNENLSEPIHAPQLQNYHLQPKKKNVAPKPPKENVSPTNPPTKLEKYFGQLQNNIASSIEPDIESTSLPIEPAYQFTKTTLPLASLVIKESASSIFLNSSINQHCRSDSTNALSPSGQEAINILDDLYNTLDDQSKDDNVNILQNFQPSQSSEVINNDWISITKLDMTENQGKTTLLNTSEHTHSEIFVSATSDLPPGFQNLTKCANCDRQRNSSLDRNSNASASENTLSLTPKKNPSMCSSTSNLVPLQKSMRSVSVNHVVTDCLSDINKNNAISRHSASFEPVCLRVNADDDRNSALFVTEGVPPPEPPVDYETMSTNKVSVQNPSKGQLNCKTRSKSLKDLPIQHQRFQKSFHNANSAHTTSPVVASENDVALATTQNNNDRHQPHDVLPLQQQKLPDKQKLFSSITNGNLNKIPTSQMSRKSPQRATVTKKTRTYVVDGVEVTSTTLHVLGVKQDYELRKNEMRDLKRMQREEARQQQELSARAEQLRDQQERKFALEKQAVHKTYESDIETLSRLQKKKMEEMERYQDEELRNLLKKIRVDQEKDLRMFREHLRHEQKSLKQELDLLPKIQRKEVYRCRKEMLDKSHYEREADFLIQLDRNQELYLGRMQEKNREKMAEMEREFLKQKHSLERSLESALWELEERQLSDKHNLIAQQFRDVFHLQRTHMLARHHKELEHIRKVNQSNEENLLRCLTADRKGLPKALRNESKTRSIMFRESLRIDLPEGSIEKWAGKIQDFDEKEKIRMRTKMNEYDVKCKRRLAQLVVYNQNIVKELEEIHNEKRSMLVDNERSKLAQYEGEYCQVIQDWKAGLSIRKSALETKFAEEFKTQERFYSIDGNNMTGHEGGVEPLRSMSKFVS